MSTETEIKCNLSEHDFIVIMSQASLLETKIHTDHYYDTPQRGLYHHDACCRIRKSLDYCELSFKDPADLGMTIENLQPMHRNEWNTPWEIGIPTVIFPLTVFPLRIHTLLSFHGILDTLTRVGTTTTRRKVLTLDGNLTFELDSVTLPNNSVYHQLEIETDNLEDRTTMFRELQKFVSDIKITDQTKYSKLIFSVL